jgi:hypothetical protein
LAILSGESLPSSLATPSSPSLDLVASVAMTGASQNLYKRLRYVLKIENRPTSVDDRLHTHAEVIINKNAKNRQKRIQSNREGHTFATCQDSLVKKKKSGQREAHT